MNDSWFETDTTLAALRAGDTAVFTQLVAHYHRRLVTFAATLVATALAEEAVQDAWLAVWRTLPGFAERATLKTWLYTIVRNSCLHCLRRDKRLRTVAIDAELHHDGIDGWFAAAFAADGAWSQAPPIWHLHSPEALLEEQQLQNCLAQHIDGLPALQRSVFQLRDIEQLPMAEICNILELSASNARVLLHRARLRLQRVIDHYQETGEC
ncbi:MAG: RNA polymerase sigma factor [Pseudomonadales bacterium]|jgi:RNA polymerase sigma-70 factor (ECF subfamily)|nr:RNA polymerase sigma factor [Pseudomonadales bacterium]